MRRRTQVANLKLPQGRKPKGIMLEPGKGYIADWVNRYTLSLFPFSVGVTGIRVLPANPMRTYLIIQNTSASNMFVNFGQNATLITGLRIVPGGNYEQLGGAPAGTFISPQDVYIIGAAASLPGVIGEGLWTSVYV